MFLLRLLAASLVLWRRVWCRLRMLLLRSAFRRHGSNFVFDPDGRYTFENIEVGDSVFIGSAAVLMATQSRIIIGNKVMFGPHVIVVGGDHNTSLLGRFMYDVQEKRPEDDQDVVIEDDVWVGSGAIILKGVRIGRGSVVAAGAVVNRDVLPYSVVGGIPARVVSVRFGDLQKLLEHESTLYPPEERLSRAALERTLEHAQRVS